MDFKLQEDEEIIDGRPYCKKCKGKRFFEYEEGYWVRSICDCQKAERDKKEEQEAMEKRMEQFKKDQRLTSMGERYFNARFKNATITENNRKVFEECKMYVNHWKEMLADGLGLYIYGDNSTGKTYLTACMCNALVAQGLRCSFTSMPQILAEIQNSYSSDSALGQAQITQMLGQKDFVFIDDLGKEFIGQSKSKFAEKVLLEVLNARYNNNKPTIFTSNYQIEDLSNMGIDKAITERVKEMGTRLLCLNGDDFREDLADKKSEKMRKLGI